MVIYLVLDKVFNVLNYIKGRQNRTLHLYVVTATNLVFKVQIQSQRRDVAQRMLVGLVVVVYIVGRSEKFLYGMVRSQKPLQMVPLYNTAITVPLLSTCTIQHGCMAFNNIP